MNPNDPYEEIYDGETVLRMPRGERHEVIRLRLQAALEKALAGVPATKLLPTLSVVQITPGSIIRPDFALVAVPTGKLWLSVEVICPDDHRADTVWKKQVYEEARVPRLWLVDPRYNNVEIYHGTTHGLSLKGILAGREELTEKLVPSFKMTMNELFEK